MLAKIEYAKMLASSGLLPKAYQKNPANILWALEYGEALNISPMAAMLGIHVIEGRPCAGAGLISGLVQKAGHRLRVRGDDKTATCEITRSDDPSFTFSATWTWERALKANLTGKTVWKQYPAAMLRARAITEAARAACQDVLYGLVYTPEELGQDALGDYSADISAEEAEPAAEAPGNPGHAEAAGEAGKASGELLAAIGAQFHRLGVGMEADDRIDMAAVLVDHPVTLPADLTQEEAEFILAELEGCENRVELDALIAERQALP